jgi:hypothetical protein
MVHERTEVFRRMLDAFNRGDIAAAVSSSDTTGGGADSPR